MVDIAAGSMDSGDCVWLTTDPDVVTARERGRALAKTLGFSATDQASVETTISELAINMLTYARSGEIRIEVVTEGASTGLRVIARDWGSARKASIFRRPAPRRRNQLADSVGAPVAGTIVTVTKPGSPELRDSSLRSVTRIARSTSA